MPRLIRILLFTLVILALPVVLRQSAQAQTFTVLYDFPVGTWSSPNGGLTMDGAGNLYGTNFAGVFKLTHAGSGWLLDPLQKFSEGGVDQGPSPGLTLTPDGSLYGATGAGGIGNCLDGQGCGTIFHLQPPPTACRTALCPWTATVLYSFTGNPPDGFLPGGDLVFDKAGNIYGTTSRGGEFGTGTVFELTLSNGRLFFTPSAGSKTVHTHTVA